MDANGLFEIKKVAEAALLKYGDYRPWRRQVLLNIERIHATAL